MSSGKVVGLIIALFLAMGIGIFGLAQGVSNSNTAAAATKQAHYNACVSVPVNQRLSCINGKQATKIVTKTVDVPTINSSGSQLFPSVPRTFQQAIDYCAVLANKFEGFIKSSYSQANINGNTINPGVDPTADYGNCIASVAQAAQKGAWSK